MRGQLFVGLLLTTIGLSGCFGDDPADEPVVRPIETPAMAFLHDLSEPDPAITVEGATLEHYRIEGPDGYELDTWVAIPPSDEPVPLVLQVTPYYPGGPPTGRVLSPVYDTLGFGTHGLGGWAQELIPRGYAVGISSVRGTGLSEGCFTQGGPSEAVDTAAVIEALAAMEWSNGNVGLIGASYPGTTPMDVWVEAPPSLKTIVPVAGITDFYKYNFVNGVPIFIQGLAFNTYYGVETSFIPYPTSVAFGGEPWRDPENVIPAVLTEPCQDQLDVQLGGATSTLDGNKDGYWEQRDFLFEYVDAPAQDRASVFYIHGLQDWNVKPHMLEDWFEVVQSSGVPFKAWLGQWAHAYPDSTSETNPCEEGEACRNDWWNLTMVAWFDQFLKGVDTGVLDMPAVQIQNDDRVWRSEHHWPPLDADWTTYFLDGEALTADGPGSGTASYFDYLGDPVRHATLGFASLDGGPLPGQAVWRSEPFEADAVVAGQPVFMANVTSSGPRASLILTLAEESPDGALRAFNFAAQSLNHARSLESGDPDVSGLEQSVWVRFFPQDDVVHEGNRLVLVAAANILDGPGPALIPIGTGSMIAIDEGTAMLQVPLDPTVTYEDPQPFDNAP